MSQTLQITRWNIQQLIGDTNPDMRKVSAMQLDQIIKANVQTMFGRIVKPRDTVTSVSLVAGTYDYSFSGETGNVSQVLLNSTGDELVRVPGFETFNAIYRQDTNFPANRGTPGEYTLWTGTNDVLRIRVGPTPSAADTLKVHLSSIPAFSSPPADADVIPFALDLLRALEMACAADCGAEMWRAKSEKALSDYNHRAAFNGYRQDSVIRGSRTWAWR